MDTDLTKSFFKTTYSLQQARARLRMLREYIIDYFFSSPAKGGMTPESDSGRGQNDGSRLRSNNIRDPWLKSLGEEFYKEFTKENVYQKLKELEDALVATEPLVVYMAFDMPDEELNKLGPWLRKNILEDMVFDTKIDQTLIGGCAFSWHGILKDYSLKSRLAQNHEEIMANIRNITK